MYPTIRLLCRLCLTIGYGVFRFVLAFAGYVVAMLTLMAGSYVLRIAASGIRWPWPLSGLHF